MTIPPPPAEPNETAEPVAVPDGQVRHTEAAGEIDAPAPSPQPAKVLLLGEEPGAMRQVAGLWSELHPDPDAPGLVIVHRAQPNSALPKTATQVALGARGWFDGERFSTPSKRLVDALTRHETARAALDQVATIVAPEALVGSVRSQIAGVTTHPIDVVSWDGFAMATHRAYLISLLDKASGRGNRPAASAALIAEAVEQPDPDGAMAAAIGRALASLSAQGGFQEIVDLAPALDRMPAAVRARHGIDAARRSSAISLGSPSEASDATAAADAFRAADAARRDGRLADAVRLVTAGLRLLFNGELHTDSEHSPLVDDPAKWLAPWRDSDFARYAYSAMAHRRTERGDDSESPARDRVVVLRGAYGNFAGPVIDLLRAAGAEPEVTDPATIGSLLTRHNIVEPLVAEWLRRIDPGTWADLPRDESAATQIAALEAAIDGAGTIFADWCDPGAVFASLAVPPGTRLVIRVHRVDAMRVWHQFVDWAAVDSVIFVADHVRDIFAAQITAPGAEPPTPLRVINNVIDVERYRRPKTPGAERRIALVGWGRRVKDPIFALDILADLLGTDPSWELHLIGRDFGEPGPGPAREYAARFRARATTAPLRDAIRWVGFTGRLEEALDQCGFALSTSRIEGWPVGVVEAAASGAIPVIREWTQLRDAGAAAAIYAATPDWVIDTPAEAAARIRSLADREDWERESERVRAAADALCEVGDTGTAYADVILGR
ncbi:MAG: glycosyltransferase [Actinobacteria bacterium]|uniref:Glycosyl transferase family 1 domain-containing protein n=1 Tax=Nostocoides veronense TaxID=330836 RepID=A0ABP4YBL9_9MICO|nr:glycosyltransferase [Actinomycetota bacterium]